MESSEEYYRLQVLDNMCDERIIRYYVHLLILVTVALRTAFVVVRAWCCFGLRWLAWWWFVWGGVNGGGISVNACGSVQKAGLRQLSEVVNEPANRCLDLSII